MYIFDITDNMFIVNNLKSPTYQWFCDIENCTSNNKLQSSSNCNETEYLWNHFELNFVSNEACTTLIINFNAIASYMMNLKVYSCYN